LSRLARARAQGIMNAIGTNALRRGARRLS
jgi:hypothetical protein